ncbi:MAG: RDD family protein [Terracidiphilus sp.]
MEPIGDQLNIDTPELVSIELPLAGIGSRFIAVLVDSLILGAVFLFLLIFAAFLLPALGAFGAKAATWGVGVFILIFFLIFWGYFALIEAFNNGRTPGKRVARIRVIHQSGRGISFVESLGRNLVRVIDWVPGFYGVGIVAIFLSRRHQRLGDMVAGTLVVREREVDAPMWGENASRTFMTAAPAAQSPMPAIGLPQTIGSESRGPWGGPPHLRVVLPAPALAKLTASDLEVLEGFFARRLDMDLATRGALALRIATALCAKSGLTIPAETSVETFLEAVAHQFRELGRMS